MINNLSKIRIVLRNLLWKTTKRRATGLRFSHADHGEWVEAVVDESLAKALSRYDRNKGRFFSFAMEIAKNLAFDELDKEERRLRALNKLALTVEPLLSPPRDEFGRYLLRDELYELLGQLSPDQRDALALYYLAELPVKEIALIMDRRANAVDALIFRALKKARILYAKQNKLNLSSKILNSRPNGRRTARPRDDLDSDPDHRPRTKPRKSRR